VLLESWFTSPFFKKGKETREDEEDGQNTPPPLLHS